jgi:hypothetical protein
MHPLRIAPIPLLIAVALACVIPVGSHARTIAAVPESSLVRSFAALAPGDTLELASGAYLEPPLVITAKGTADSPITIRSAKGGRAWIARGTVIEPAGAEASGQASHTDAGAPWAAVDSERGIWRLDQPAPSEPNGAFLSTPRCSFFRTRIGLCSNREPRA